MLTSDECYLHMEDDKTSLSSNVQMFPTNVMSEEVNGNLILWCCCLGLVRMCPFVHSSGTRLAVRWRNIRCWYTSITLERRRTPFTSHWTRRSGATRWASSLTSGKQTPDKYNQPPLWKNRSSSELKPSFQHVFLLWRILCWNFCEIRTESFRKEGLSWSVFPFIEVRRLVCPTKRWEPCSRRFLWRSQPTSLNEWEVSASYRGKFLERLTLVCDRNLLRQKNLLLYSPSQGPKRTLLKIPRNGVKVNPTKRKETKLFSRWRWIWIGRTLFRINWTFVFFLTRF